MKVVSEKYGCYLIDTITIPDSRGWFNITYDISDYKKYNFKQLYQVKHSYSKEAGIVRGMHFQEKPYNLTKIVRCLKGSLYSVGVDLDKNSENYGKYVGFELTGNDHLVMIIPNTFANGIISLEKDTELELMTDNEFNKKCGKGFKFDDKDVNIDWTVGGKVVVNYELISDGDKNLPGFKDINF